ncbi:terminase small subunit [Marinilactibacillus psychrotolerans]|nr:terminase small subunit [Marinilactibacillus psychrotolerans]
MAKEVKLTDNRKRFCEAYVELFGNGTQAYLKAYPKVKKEATARANASRLLTIANVQDYIAELTKSLNNERIMSVEEALALSTSIARGEPQPSTYREYNEDGDVTEDIKEYSAGIKERVAALEHIYKANSAFIDKKEIDTTIRSNKLDSILDQLTSDSDG